jgi:hypothetical protein
LKTWRGGNSGCIDVPVVGHLTGSPQTEKRSRGKSDILAR